MNRAIGGRAGRLFLFVALLSCAGGVTTPRDLTFEERVAAQRAIERVYYQHQIGASRPFEEAVPDAAIRRKVEAYLEQSLALEQRWATPVTTKMLEAEMRRMAGGTRMPERLRELHQALGNDPYLIRETLVRAALVDRLSRSFSAGGDPFGRGLPADTSEANVSGEVTAPSTGPAQAFISTQGRGGGAYAGEALSVSACVPDDTWDNGVLDDLPSARSLHTAVWTGSLVIIWGGQGSIPATNTGSRYDPAIDSWSSTSITNAPSARRRHTAVWTGSEMIVWGGHGTTFTPQLSTGGRYDPISDTWAPLSTDDAPPARDSHVAVWTGSLMLVWGGEGSGSSGRTDGGRYDPVSDAWTPIAMGGPEGTIFNTAVWTGSEMIVWGGRDKAATPSSVLNTGARYDPGLDAWASVSTAGAPGARQNHTAVWTGSEMIVWGGAGGAFIQLDTGGRYDPSTDAWEPTSTSSAPDIRTGHTAVWTGSRMIVWGGVQLPCCDFSVPLDSGGSYDPVADTWVPTSLTGAPGARDTHTALWTGDRMIVWGGHVTDVGFGGTRLSYQNSGGRYDPLTDTWTPTSQGQGPFGMNQTGVWTGREMIVWGGRSGVDASTRLRTGGRYDPATDSWTPTSLLNAPSVRDAHTAVWTGQEMIIWGGAGSGVQRGGGRYDPLLDVWTPVSDAPEGSTTHTAVWTGQEMMVWGGFRLGLTDQGTGYLYDPALDSWRLSTLTNAPVNRFAHVAVWTGDEMIVWGGRMVTSTGTTFYLGDGSRYDPVADAWTTVNPFGAPSERDGHSAVWTGEEMIIWGGRFIGTDLDTGARYDLRHDAWTPVTANGAPSRRSSHTAVWTGDEMIVWAGTFSGNTGGRYDPQHDTWAATSTVGAPTPRTRHIAIWAGSHMIVWGGTGGEGTGGRYAIDRDGDDDGFTPCDGDCDDSDPAVNPDAAEVCNGIDDDCDASTDEEGDALCDDESACTTDTCAGQDGCVNAPLPEGTLCPGGSAGGQCAAPDTCDAQGQCQVGLPVPAGIPCGNPDDTSCSNPDTCDGFGECGPNHEPDGTACSRRHGDDDDDGHGDDDDGGGHDDDDDGGGDDHCDVCVAGECVRLDDEPHPPGDDDHDCDEDGVNDDAFDTLRLTLAGPGSLSLSWAAPPVPQGSTVTGYRVWRRDRQGCPWRLVAQTSAPGVTLSILPGDGDAIYDVTAITTPPP